MDAYKIFCLKCSSSNVTLSGEADTILKCNSCGHETVIDGFALGRITGVDEIKYLDAFTDVAAKQGNEFLRKRRDFSNKIIAKSGTEEEDEKPDSNWLCKILRKLKIWVSA